MYRIFTLIVFCLAFVFTASSQLVINEIMYNPPEGGDDSLEYVEIINASSDALNLAGYKLSDGVSGNLPAIMLGSGQYLLMAKDSVAIQTVFGIVAYQWTTGSLNNTGELITLRNPSDAIIDEVNFMEVAPWPDTQADGKGPSLELCDPSLNNNDGANWRASVNATGKIINNIEIKASPNASNGLSCIIEPDYVVEVKNFSFTPKDLTINIGETVRWSNLGGHHNVNGDQSVYPNNSESFGNGALSSNLWTFDYTFNKVGKYDYRCDAHFSGGMVGTVTVEEPVVTIPKYAIAQVTGVNAQGVADSINVVCELEGTVYGINLRPGGLQFTIIDDNNNGIAVFSNSSDFGYTVTEGEVVSIQGKIEQFNGLTQIVVSNLAVLSQSSPLVSAKEVTSFSESDESSLVVVNNLNYEDISQWKGDGSSFNVSLTDGTNTFAIRIDNDVDLAKQPAPVAPLKVTGLLGQFDNTSPYDAGYQLLPRYALDVVSLSSTEEEGVKTAVKASPNPFHDKLSLISEYTIQGVKVFDSKGGLVLKCDHQNLDMSGLQSGLYLVQVMTVRGMTPLKVIKI